MTNNRAESRTLNTPVVFFLLALMGAASFGLPLLRASATVPNEPIRVVLVRKFIDNEPAAAKDLELNFTGLNGKVTGLSASNEKTTINFERGDNAELSCPRGKVRECESISLKAGGKLTACGCAPPAPVTQTREHILLAKQVGVPSMMQKNSQPTAMVTVPVSADRTYDVELGDKSFLRATEGGRQTCWINRKARVRICY